MSPFFSRCHFLIEKSTFFFHYFFFFSVLQGDPRGRCRKVPALDRRAARSIQERSRRAGTNTGTKYFTALAVGTLSSPTIGGTRLFATRDLLFGVDKRLFIKASKPLRKGQCGQDVCVCLARRTKWGPLLSWKQKRESGKG